MLGAVPCAVTGNLGRRIEGLGKVLKCYELFDVALQRQREFRRIGLVRRDRFGQPNHFVVVTLNQIIGGAVVLGWKVACLLGGFRSTGSAAGAWPIKSANSDFGRLRIERSHLL